MFYPLTLCMFWPVSEIAMRRSVTRCVFQPFAFDVTCVAVRPSGAR
jgi:hypothetical protein